LVAAGDLLVAWGRVPQPDRNQFGDMGGVFVSRDGRTWQEIAIDHGVNDANTSTISGVAAGPLGYLAIGNVCCEPESAAIWHSDDAITWRRLELEGDINGFVTAAIGVEGGWVALGGTRDGSAGELWFSADGRTWETVLRVESGPFARGLADLARGPHGLVAVGTVIAPDGSYDGGVWRSDDGRSWDRIGADDPALSGIGEAQLTAVLGHAGGIFVNGIFGSAEERRQCEDLLSMVSSIDPRPAPPVRPDATSCMNGSEHQWSSPDGATWERIGPRAGDPANPIEFRVVTAGGPGLVLLGETTRPPSPDTALFTSPDGLAWTAVEPPGPVGTEVAIGIAVRGRQLIAITEAWDGVSSSFRSWIGTVAP
jgi:hypothetical protein